MRCLLVRMTVDLQCVLVDDSRLGHNKTVDIRFERPCSRVCLHHVVTVHQYAHCVCADDTCSTTFHINHYRVILMNSDSSQH